MRVRTAGRKGFSYYRNNSSRYSSSSLLVLDCPTADSIGMQGTENILKVPDSHFKSPWSSFPVQKPLSIPASPICASELWRPDLKSPWPRLADTYNSQWRGTKQGLVRWWRVSSSFSLSNSKRYGDIKLGRYQLQIIVWDQHWRPNLRQADLIKHHSKGAGNKTFLIFADIKCSYTCIKIVLKGMQLF